jgi:hypothetical protein
MNADYNFELLLVYLSVEEHKEVECAGTRVGASLEGRT